MKYWAFIALFVGVCAACLAILGMFQNSKAPAAAAAPRFVGSYHHTDAGNVYVIRDLETGREYVGMYNMHLTEVRR